MDPVSAADRRNNPRSAFELPVVFSTGENPQAITRDVSQGGVYFYTDTPLAIGQTLEFKVLMPGPQTRALCKGTVLRLDQDTGMRKTGVAVHLTGIRLER